MTKKPYTKPPLPVQDQINLLKNRGLRIPDEEKAARYLRNISYYRLSGYMYPFLTDAKQHLYKDGTVFEDILSLYRFDLELRLLVFSAIEKVEVAFRAQIINEYSVALTEYMRPSCPPVE
jgi:abortive infection bacteriophage resistance protein